jgi:NAD(P)-dependent dehydrogenase (short-subunit alcohol dehydrogenase family)
MTEHPFAIVHRGFSDLGISIGTSLKKNYAVAFFNAYESEVRNKVIDDGYSYVHLESETEEHCLHSLQGVLVCFANVRLLVNIIEPNEIFGSSTFEQLSQDTIKAKVSKYIEGTLAMIKVVSMQMASQQQRAGFKGHIINVVNAPSKPLNPFLFSMISGAISNMTGPLAERFLPYRIRVNTILIDSKDVAIPTETATVTMSNDILSAIDAVLADSTINAQKIRLLAKDVRL